MQCKDLRRLCATRLSALSTVCALSKTTFVLSIVDYRSIRRSEDSTIGTGKLALALICKPNSLHSAKKWPLAVGPNSYARYRHRISTGLISKDDLMLRARNKR